MPASCEWECTGFLRMYLGNRRAQDSICMALGEGFDVYLYHFFWVALVSSLPSGFGSQSEKEQATLERFCCEKEFGMKELMRRAVEKEYHGVLGIALILSCRSGGIMDWMWNQVMCIWFGFSLVGVEKRLVFP